MIDINKITSVLAKLQDPQLQQYAQLHKNDPYIMALAMSESNRRKELRSAGQGMQGMQEQPKVVDQMVAQMVPQQLPENQGIGQLPAGDMNFAGGGIVAFADGGDVEHYYGGGSTAIYDPVTGVPISAENTSGNDLTFLESIGVFNPENRRALEQADRAAAQKQSTIPYNRATMPAPGYTRTDPRAAGANTFEDTVKAISAAPTADTGRKDVSGIGAPRAPAAPAQSVAQRYAAMQNEMGLGNREALDTERAGLTAAMRKTAADEAAEFEKDVAARGEAFKGREERLAKRETGLGKMKDETAGLSLLEAGLAIMSTPGGLATAIGKGAQTGLKTYGAGLEKLRSAQEKMDDARDQIEEFRRNEANMTAKERRQFKSNINRTEAEIQKMGVDAAEKMYGYKREDAKAVFAADTQERISENENKTRLQAARIGATQQTPAQMQIALALGKGDLEAGLGKMRAIEAGKFSVSNSYADYLKAFAGKETITPPLSFANYAAQFGAVLPR